MSKTIKMLTVVLAVCAFSAVVSAQASAGEWFVGGSVLKGSAAIAGTASLSTAGVMKAPAVENATVDCKVYLFLAHAAIVAGQPELAAAFTAAFFLCEAFAQTGTCALGALAINSSLLNATVKVGSKSPEDRVLVLPRTKSLLAEIPFSETNTCAFAGVEGVKGSVTLAMPTGQSEESAQAIEGLGSVENNSLEIANSKAYITGRALVKLASGSKWSFH
jgi:hypothetical protein